MGKRSLPDRNQWLALSVPIVFLCAGNSVAADVPADDGMLSESEFLAEVPTVLTVSRLAQPVSEAPSAVTVIDRDMISNSGFQEIADLFRLVPGFYVGHYSGHEQVVGHGLTNRYFGRIQVMVDGRSVYSPMWGQVQWSDLQLAIDDIERIEVTRGPNAASYGANSFQGVINIVTRHAREDKGTLLSFVTGENGVNDSKIRHGGTLADWDYRLTLGQRADDGFENRNDRKHVDLLTLRADRQLDQTDSLQVQLGYNGGTRGMGFTGYELDTFRDKVIESNFQQFKWQRAIGADDETSVQFSHAYHDVTDTAVTAPFVWSGLQIYSTVLHQDLRSDRYDLEFQRNQSPLDGVRLAWGGSMRLDNIYAPVYLGTSDSKTSHQQQIFGNGEWRVTPRLFFNAGAMFEHNDVSGSNLSPRAAINFHLTPNNTFRVGTSKAYRTPTLLEENANYYNILPVNTPTTLVAVPSYISAGGLKPEKITSTEVGYLGRLVNYGLSLDVRVYRDEIENIITAYRPPKMNVFIPGVGTVQLDYWGFKNDELITVTGVESQLRWSPASNTHFIFGHAYTHVVSHAFDKGAAEDFERSSPNHIFNLLAMHGFGSGLNVSLGYYHVSEMRAMGDGEALGVNRRLDTRIAQKFKIAGKRAEAGFVVQNLLAPYYEFRQDNRFDRRMFVTFRLEL